jgi:Uma2 family endonuclease
MSRAITTIPKPRKRRVALWADHDDSGKPHPGRRMTEAEFVEWCDERTHAEWVNGEVIVMSPTNFNHADLNTWLTVVLRSFVEFHDPGFLVGPQVQMRLANIVSRREPDVLFVAKSRKRIIKETIINGAPDLVIEIVSPESTARDWRDKHAEYATGGIKEYWIIDPKTRKCEASALTRAKTYRLIEASDGMIHSTVLKGFYLKPSWLWQPALPKVSEIERELGLR